MPESRLAKTRQVYQELSPQWVLDDIRRDIACDEKRPGCERLWCHECDPPTLRLFQYQITRDDFVGECGHRIPADVYHAANPRQ